MLAPGQNVTLEIEKPAAGGRMIARLNGQVILVSGAIPGETVSAIIERVGRGVVYAAARTVETASADRRAPFTDLACGGSLYAHIAYARQLTIKGQVIADAFGRIGRLPLASEPSVMASPEEGYRMRARLHVRGGSVGFFREGTHEICAARATRQLLPTTCDALDRLSERLGGAGGLGVHEVEVAENIEASERVVHLALSPSQGSPAPGPLSEIEGMTGVLAGERVVAGGPYVTDSIPMDGHTIVLRRHVLAFFQGNRYLLGALMAHVVRGIEPEATVVDLYSGVGVFALAAAVARGARVTAVEGDRVAAADLDANTEANAAAIETIHTDVERFMARSRPRPDVLIVDPPRTGMSNDALQGTIRLAPRRLVYVSCDVATLARDARKLVDAGYQIQAVDGFDLFPNTPHVETVVRFERT